MKKRILSMILVLAMIVSILPAAIAVDSGMNFGNAPVAEPTTEGPLGLASSDGTEKTGLVMPETVSGMAAQGETDRIVNGSENAISKNVDAAPYAADDEVTFMVILDRDSLLKAGYSVDQVASRTPASVSYERLQNRALNTVKQSMSETLTGAYEIGYTYTVATTGLSVTTRYGNRDALAAIDGVKTVYVAPTYNLPEDYTVNLGDVAQPMTSNATTMIGADVLNASGYTGKGMRVCILDTGIVVNHPSFQPLSEDKLTETSLTFAEVESVWSTLNASHANGFVENAYVSTKIPFVCNYYTQGFDVSHATAGSDHGTHVAGIAAANVTSGTTVRGVAPDAQLIIMQVFGRSGAGWDTIMAALEDAVRLNVDTCNLSLGSAAGFVDPEGDMLDTVELFKTTDISLVMANGNDTNNALNNLTGMNMSLSSNPDVGLAGTPASYSASLAVASIDNDGVEQLYFTVNGTSMGFNDTATSGNVFAENYRGQTLDFVCVPGVGSDSDYEGLDVTGKVAVISRGSISFPEKQSIAQARGAIAAVIYNNDSGLLNMQINSGASNIPCVSITKADGLKLVAIGSGKLTVCNGDLKKFNIDKAVSDFSSWGSTSDLTLKPEIAGVGGNIYSSTDPSISGSNYGTMSGTSMASPQVTGAMTIIMEYLRAHYSFTEAELRQVAANIAMSTANPVMLGDVEYSPRQQGAGLVDLVKATTTHAYLSNPEASEGRPKAELGDDDAKTGVYTFPVKVVNFGTETQTYTFSASVLSEQLYLVDGQGFIGNEPVRLDAALTVTGAAAETVLKYDFNDDGEITTADTRCLLRHVAEVEAITNVHAAYTDVNGDGVTDAADVDVITTYCAELPTTVDVLAEIETAGQNGTITSVTVPAGKTETVYATITLTEDDKEYLDLFENGIWVEGFLYLNNAEGVSLEMPFMGFYGDWSAAPVFDSPNEAEATLYPRYVFTNYSVVGENPYLRNGKSGDQYNAFSYSNPLAEMDFGMLRSAKKLNFTVTDKETGEEYFYIYGTDITKSYYVASYGQIIPFYIYGDEIWNGLDANGKKLPDGTTVTYAVEAWLDDGDDVMDDAFYFDITVDDAAPKILNVDSLNDALTFENGATYLDLNLEDNRYIAAVLFIDPNGIILGRYEVNNEPGVAAVNRFEITGYGTDFTILVADYACNEYEIDVVMDYGEHANDVITVKPLDKNRIYGSDPAGNGDVDVGWFSANKADMSDLKNETYDTTNYYYSAEYVNGNVIAQSAITGDLVLVQPRGTYWATTSLVSQYGKQIGDPNVWVLYDLALVHNENGKDQLFATGWYYEGDNDGDGKDDGANYIFEVCFYDWGTISVDRLAKVSGTDGVDLLTLGATTQGTLYGIDTNAKLYTVDPYSGECTYVATTGFVNVAGYNGANLIQSMGYDHNTGDMYWFATSQSVSGSKYVYAGGTYKLDLTNGAITKVDNTNNLTGSTGLFIPNDLQSDLFELGKTPTRFQLDPYETMMATGQTKRVNVKWEPWNATPNKVTWTSDNEAVATVNDAGFVKAVSEGSATITATAEVWYEGWEVDDDGNWNYIEGPKDYSATCRIEVIPSEENLYGFVVSDFKATYNNFSWIKYSDQNLYAVENLGGNKLPAGHFDGNSGDDTALWQGGAYYNGYVYLAAYDVWDDMEMSGTGIYRFSVTPNGDEPAIFGALEFVGFTPNILIGNMAFDYKTGRMYGVDLTNGGLALVDIETGAVDALGVFGGDIGGPAIAPAMCVVAREDMDDSLIIISDMHGKLYTVNADNMSTSYLGQCSQENTWYYAAMTYDYNTDNIYWNPCMSQGQSPMLLVKLGQDQWSGNLAANIVDIGDVSTKAGVEQTVIFTIPEQEPATHYIPIESMRVTSEKDVKGLEGGIGKVTVATTPSRPSVLRKAFTSSNEAVVTVDNFGNLTYTGVGTAVVTCTMQNRPNEDGTPGQVFTDSVNVTVYEAAGEIQAFLAYDTGTGGSGYYDYWLNMTDARVDAVTLGTRCINVYDISAGAYYDGYYYALTRTGTPSVLRISAQDPTKYVTLSSSNLLDTERVVSMAVDYTTGIMYAVTGDSWLASLNMDNGQFTKLVRLNVSACTIAVDGQGTIYVAGSASEGESAVAYTVNKQTGACTRVGTFPGAVAYTGYWSYADMNYNPQMAYDYSTNRLYLYASLYSETARNNVSGLYLMDLDDGMTMFVGKLGIDFQRGAAIKYGAAYLGLMDIIPEEGLIPVAPVNGIMLNKNSGRIPVGGTAQLIATVRPSNATDKSVTWTSSNEAVATVDGNGLVSGISEGTVTITVTSNQTGVSNSAVLNVVDVSGAASIAYTVSADLDSLVSFNPAAPAQTMEVVDILSGGAIIKGMAYYQGSLFYATEGGFPDIYAYNMTTHQTTYVGSALNYNNASDIAVDEVTGRLYVCGGLYVNAFDLNTLVQGSIPAASLLEQYYWGEAEGIAVGADGVYYLINSNGVHHLFRVDKALNQSSVQEIGTVDVDAVGGKTEMAYDASTGLLYVTDGSDNLYSVDPATCAVTAIDCVGTGIDVNGLAIVQH